MSRNMKTHTSNLCSCYLVEGKGAGVGRVSSVFLVFFFLKLGDGNMASVMLKFTYPL